MRENWFEMPITFKLWMLCNHQPEITGQDEGIWASIDVIPFDVTIPERDRIPDLSEILISEEGPGILAWIIEGAMEWKRIGLAPSKRVEDAVAKYRSDQDIIGDFLEQKCDSYLDDDDLKSRFKVKAALLYNAFTDHCKQSGDRDVLDATAVCKGPESARLPRHRRQRLGLSGRISPKRHADKR